MAKTGVKNEGDLAEAVLGAAIVAKLGARTGGKIAKIGSNEIKKILQLMQRATVASTTAFHVVIKMDSGGKAKDRIAFMLKIKSTTMSELLSLKSFTEIDSVLRAAASYVNAPRTEALAERAYTNNINNKISVVVDGISNAQLTKADLLLTVDDLVFDKISLKAGTKANAKSLGQVGGATWAAIRRVFADGYNERTKKYESGLELPINNTLNEQQYMKLLTEDPNFTTLSAAVSWTYKKADDMFNSLGSTKAAKVVFDFVNQHSALNDPSIRIVEFHLGKHKVLNPLVLEGNLRGVRMKALTLLKEKWPLFIVYDAADGVPQSQYSPNVIFAVRPKADTRSLYITHIIEKGARLSQLMDVTGKE